MRAALLALLVLVSFDVSNLNGVIADQAGISPYRAQLALAVVALLALLTRPSIRAPFVSTGADPREPPYKRMWSPVLLGLGVLLAGFAVSLVGAADPALSSALLIERLRDFVYAVVVYALLLTTDSVRAVVRSVVLVLAALAALTAVHEFVLGNQGDLFGLSRVPLVQESGAATPRHAGTSSDVNFWSRLLILFTPLALSLWAAATGRVARLIWLACGLSLMAGVYLTQSRGGFLALFLAVLVWLAVAGGWYRRALLAVPLVVAALVPVLGIGSRLGTLATSAGAPDPSLVERRRLQANALLMFTDRPVNGHGIGSYPVVFPGYDRLADTYQPVDIVVAAHNLYLEQAADGGILLFVAWTVFIGTVLFAAVRALLLARRAGEPGPAWLAIGVLAGLLGWLGASLFLHLSDFRALLLVAALAAALDVQARRLPPSPAGPSPAARAVPGRRVLVGLTVLAVASAGGLAAALTNGARTYTSSATLAVVPAGKTVSGGTAYQLDVVSRGIIVPSLATVLDASATLAEAGRGAATTGGATVLVTPSDQGGALLVRTTAADPVAAETLGRAAVAAAQDDVARLDTGYQLSGSSGAAVAGEPRGRWLGVPCSLGLAAAALGLVRVRRGRSGLRY